MTMRWWRRVMLPAVALTALALSPGLARACSVCYGDPDSAMSRGLGWGIAALLGVVLVVLGGVTSFFVYVGRRSGSGDAAAPAADTIQGS